MWPFQGIDKLTFLVPCRLGNRGRWTSHPVTVDSSWTVTTPHDLELERIAGALSERVTCLDLVDYVMPHIAWSWGVTLRCPQAMREFFDGFATVDGQRRVLSALDCEGAIDYLRSGDFWLATNAPKQYIKNVCDALVKAVPYQPVSGEYWHWVWPNSVVEVIRKPSYRADELLAAGFGWSDLRFWYHGLHPDFICDVHQRLAEPGEILPLTLYFQVMSNAIDLDWLAGIFTDFGAEVGVWAAADFGDFDRTTPDARRRWLESGFHPKAVSQFLRHPYSVADIDRLAETLAESRLVAGQVLSDWLRNGWAVDIDDLILAYSANPGGCRVPSLAAVKTLELADLGSAALILTAIGTPTEARAAMKSGVKTVAGAVRWRRWLDQ